MYYNGVGLSANQIGIGERVFIMMLNMETEETITCFNPRIIKRYEDDVWCEEGCLSFPDEIINIQRPNRIVIMESPSWFLNNPRKDDTTINT